MDSSEEKEKKLIERYEIVNGAGPSFQNIMTGELGSLLYQIDLES